MIPLGILATTAGGAAAGAYELISTTVLGANTATVSFSSIPQTYKHLQVRMVARNSSAASQQNLAMQFNNTGGTAYASHRLFGDGGSVYSQATTSTFYSVFGFIGANSQTSNIFTPAVIDVLDYASTTKNKTIRGLSGFTGNLSSRVVLGSGLFADLTAVTRLDLAMNTGDFMAGSRFSLYGIK